MPYTNIGADYNARLNLCCRRRRHLFLSVASVKVEVNVCYAAALHSRRQRCHHLEHSDSERGS